MDIDETFPATVGQLSLWRDLEKMPVDRRWELNHPFLWGIPQGHSVDEVWTALEALAMRHESLRTTYIVDPAGQLRQRIAAHDPSTALASVRQGNVDASEQTTLEAEQTHRPIDVTVEMPWRLWVVTADGAPAHVQVIMHHIGADGVGVVFMESDFQRLLAGESLPVAYSPREMALHQHGDGTTRLRTAERLWRKTLSAAPRQSTSTTPAVRFGATLHTGIPVPMAHDGAAKLDISLESLLLAAYYRGLRSALGSSAVLMFPISSNRFDPDAARLVTTLAQWVPMLVDFDDSVPFEEIARKLHWNSIKALKYGVCDPDVIINVRNEFERKDPPVDAGFYFNPIVAPVGFPSADTFEPSTTEWYVPERATGPGVYAIVRGLTSIDVIVRANRAGFDKEALSTCFASIQDALLTAVGRA